MQYTVFPFGKHKGVAIKELSTTYLVYALENFELPYELSTELMREVEYRLSVISVFHARLYFNTKKLLDQAGERYDSQSSELLALREFADNLIKEM